MQILDSALDFITGANEQNKLGRMRGDSTELDPYPGVAGTLDDGFGFVGINPDLPAVGTDESDIVSILKQIAINTAPKERRGNQVVQFYHSIPATVAGERIFYLTEPSRNVLISNPPIASRALQVYAGAGLALYLGNVPEGMIQIMNLPFDLDALTIAYATGDVGDHFSVVFSQDTFSITTSGDFF